MTLPHVKIDYTYPESVDIRSYHPTVKGHPKQIHKALDVLLAAKKPIIYTGGGVILGDACEELRSMVKTLGYPITETLMGLGSFPGTDDQNIGMLGMHGTYEANMAMHHADVIFAIGARFDDRITGDVKKFAPNAKVIHIDIDPTSISKTINAHIPIVGEVKDVLTQINAELEKRELANNQQDIIAWWQQINEWQSENCLDFDSSGDKIRPQQVIKELYEVTKGEAFITSDVGQHQMFAAQFYPFDKPRRWINSGGLGTMGFGLPAAMGVKFAHPDADVACVTGDGSVQMMTQELSTCLQYDTPIKIILLNNGYLGMVRQWQEFFYERRYSHVYMDSIPDFVKLAESYGHVGIRVEKQADLKPALEKAFAMKDRTVFLDIITTQEENVFPMISAGSGHNEMDLSPLQRAVQAKKGDQ